MLWLLMCGDTYITMFYSQCRIRKMRTFLLILVLLWYHLSLFFLPAIYECSADSVEVIVRYGILYISYNTLPGANCARVKYRWNSNSISSIIVPDWTCEASLSRTKIIRLMRELWKSHSHEGKLRPRGV